MKLKSFLKKIIEKKSVKNNQDPKKEMGFFATLALAAVLAIFFRSFFYEPFHIPSGSMKPTLLVGDYVFVSKMSYGYSRFSFPFGYKIRYFEGRIFKDVPQRGDVAVFRLPKQEHINYIKRIIGLPGDEIQVKDGILFINGNEIEREFDGFFIEENKFEELKEIVKFKENLTPDKEVIVLDENFNSDQDNTIIYKVPAGHYFVMGDNRDNSKDSRFSDVGYIPEENLVGKAQIIFFSNPESIINIFTWIKSIKFSRIFDKIN